MWFEFYCGAILSWSFYKDLFAFNRLSFFFYKSLWCVVALFTNNGQRCPLFLNFLLILWQHLPPFRRKLLSEHREANMRSNNSIQGFLSWTWLLDPTERTFFTTGPIKRSVPKAIASMTYYAKDLVNKCFTLIDVQLVFWELEYCCLIVLVKSFIMCR